MKEEQTFAPDTLNPVAQLLVNVLSAFAEFERPLIREPQADGICIAEAADKDR